MMMMRFKMNFMIVWCVLQCLAHSIRIPGGLNVPESCIHVVPKGVVVDESYVIPKCEREDEVEGWNETMIQIYAADVHAQTNETQFRSMTSNVVVPPVPTEKSSQTVYFWPGFKSQSPEMGYPVIQPVLQFGEYNSKWQLQSWFVDANSFWYPTVTADAIDVNEGDEITMSMVLGDDDMWTISGIDLTTGQDSTLRITRKKAGKCNYNWAMLVNENINVNDHCDRMPDSTNGGVTFTNVTVNGVTQPQDFWTTRANCADPANNCDCGNSASVDSQTGDVTLGWKKSQ